LTGGESVESLQRGGGGEVVGSPEQPSQQEGSGGVDAVGIHCGGAERIVETGALSSAHLGVPYGFRRGRARCHGLIVAFNLTKYFA
jgi:hypothetical protein